VLELLDLEYNIIKTMKELQMNGNEQTNWYQGTDEETSALINKKQWDSPDAMAKSSSSLVLDSLSADTPSLN
jgi:hypothetical protein